ncbi:MAG: hypothetical protein ACYCU8_00695 [Ferrimicrobium acidiphilum]
MTTDKRHVTIRQQDDGFLVTWYSDLSDAQGSTIFAATYQDALRYKDKLLGLVA